MFRPFTKHLLFFNTPWGSHFQASLRTFPSRWSNKKITPSALFNDADVEETFIHGWGPGGQAINKTANCVRLTHFPTGITVKCQDSRDLQVNRIIARRRLEERLDVFYNGENSAIALRRREAEIKENNRFSRAKRRLEMKAAWKKSLEENQPPN